MIEKTYPLTRQGVRNLNLSPNAPSRVNIGPTERAASTLGGSVLTGWGLGHGGLLGLALASFGGALIYRGVTGHCSGYAAAGVNTAK